ncbi:MAG TPA: OmpA family protein [Chitinophagaceae bacterium]|nr:OmpA family protein [Chitinophagaceae bacterium]
MRKLILLLLFAAVISPNANSQILKRISDRAKNKIEQKAGDKVEKEIDNAADAKKNESKESGETEEKSDKKDETESKESSSSTTSAAKSPGMKAYSKYDFIPGEKVIAFEDFSITETGDFPTRWNTNGTAEVVTVSSKPGKWLKINKEATFHPEFISNLPENFTLEYDLGVSEEWNSSPFALNITFLKKPEDYTRYNHYVQYMGDHTLHMNFKPSNGTVQGNSHMVIGSDGNYSVNNDVEFKTWNNANNNFAHISLWRQKERLRVYLNGEKIWDLPKAFKSDSKYNAVTMAAQSSYREADYFLVGNIRLAIGAPDTRNKLITEGKFVTSGILFDVNKDDIKPESYGTLKAIANVLSENADIKVKIIGHTDSDGDDKKNLELSKKRAEAVKSSLSKDFGIDESRMETDGKGESQPVDKNESAMGKANNRRVEFIKQ